MKLSEIQDLWEADSKIDKTELGQESVKIPQLQHRYLKIRAAEKLLYRKLNAEMQVLKRDKHLFFSDGPTAESQEKEWYYPTRGKILKSDTGIFMDADNQIQELQNKMEYQMQKVETLDYILSSLAFRSNQIKNAIDYLKFTEGR